MSTLLFDRPVATDPILLHAFARRDRPLGFGDLLRAMCGTGVHVSDLMAMLAEELADGRLTPGGYRCDGQGRPFGPRLYELTELGWAAVAADRLAV